jgi:hypothetical protein
MGFIKANITFLLACIATFTSFVWLIAAPDFEPVVTTVVGIITCLGFRPKDWMIILKRSEKELPKFEYKRIDIKANQVRKNIHIEESGFKRFNYDYALDDRDKSVEFSVPPSKYKYNDWSHVPIRIVVLSQSNSWGENKHYVYAVVPDKSPVCFYQFEGICCELCIDDVDGDGVPEILIGYKCGGHSEGLKVFRVDNNFDIVSVAGSDIGSDFPLITWGSINGTEFIINSYSRNWSEDRESWQSLIESYRYEDERFILNKSGKIQWQSA